MNYAPLTSKQTKFIKDSLNHNKWLSVLEGGKRAGKNVISIIAFSALLEEHPDKIHLVGGYSNATAQTNVIDCNGFGLESIFAGRCRWGKYKNNQALYIQTLTGEKVVVVAGGGKADSYKAIKGNTYGMAYLDEVNELHPSFIKETIDRTLASSLLKHMWTLNPKSPKHKFYTEILDALQEKKEVLYGHFNIFDNLAITNARLEQMEAMYDKESIWYKRDILGMRIAAEGLIYTAFDRKYHVTDTFDDRYRIYTCGIDLGGTDATVFTLCGINTGMVDVLETKYHKNKKAHGYEKGYEAYINDFVEWATALKKIYPAWKDIYCESADKLFRITLQKALDRANLRMNVFASYKGESILERIQLTERLMVQNRLRINHKCKELIEAFENAMWDSKAEEKGELVRLDDGSSNIDSLDSFEYAIIPYKGVLI